MLVDFRWTGFPWLHALQLPHGIGHIDGSRRYLAANDQVGPDPRPTPATEPKKPVLARVPPAP